MEQDHLRYADECSRGRNEVNLKTTFRLKFASIRTGTVE